MFKPERIHSLSVAPSRFAAFRQLRISRGLTRMWRSVLSRAAIFHDVYTACSHLSMRECLCYRLSLLMIPGVPSSHALHNARWRFTRSSCGLR